MVLCIFFFCRLAFPYSTSVVFGPGDDGVAVVVEGAREDLVRVPLQNLQAVAAVRLPHSRRLVTDNKTHTLIYISTYKDGVFENSQPRGSEYARALWIESDL